MPVNLIDVSGAASLKWDEITQTLADCIDLNIHSETSGAKVYPNWVYEIDVTTMLGKITNHMRAEAGTSIGKVHCWSIGIASATFETNAQGVVPVIGAENSQWNWQILLDIWGFFEYDGTSASQKRAQDEARLVAAALYRNANVMVAEVPRWSDMSPLRYSAIQPMPMSGGNSLVVASGSLMVEVQEALGI